MVIKDDRVSNSSEKQLTNTKYFTLATAKLKEMSEQLKEVTNKFSL